MNAHRRCSNRLVGKGIHYKLQVFRRSEDIVSSSSSSSSSPLRKRAREAALSRSVQHWGLRTLEHIPAGAFVIEFCGQYVRGSKPFSCATLLLLVVCHPRYRSPLSTEPERNLGSRITHFSRDGIPQVTHCKLCVVD
jgi:hypothetical protein